MAHPYLKLFRDPDVRTLWGGLALSAVGSSLYGVGAIWLAVSVAKADGAYLAAAQSAAILAASLFGGPIAEILPRRAMLIGADLIGAALSVAVVAVALVAGLGLPVLIIASSGLAALGALFSPALQSSLPRLVPGHDRLRETNGLFDATNRIAQVVGPFLAAALLAVIPAIHLLTANALSFLASAAAIALMGRRLEDPSAAGGQSRAPVVERLVRGVAAASRCPGAWRILISTGLRGGVYAVGFNVGVPLLFAGRRAAGFGGVGAVALVFGAAAAGELISNLVTAATGGRRAWRQIFLGYVIIGGGVALVGAAELALAGSPRVAAMVLFAFAIGWGGGMAGLQMLTFFGRRMSADEFAGVLRLRLALITASTMLATGAGPWILGKIGPGWTALGGGMLTLATALVCGLLGPAPRTAAAISRAEATDR